MAARAARGSSGCRSPGSRPSTCANGARVRGCATRCSTSARSGSRARVGKLNRQGSPHLRWALYEAALSACRPSSPDHADYLALKARGLSHTRASLTIARKLARRSFHVLRELGPAALDPVRRPDRGSLRHARDSPMITLPASSLSYRGSHPSRRRPTKDRAAGVTPPGLTDQPSRHRPPPGRGPR